MQEVPRGVSNTFETAQKNAADKAIQARSELLPLLCCCCSTLHRKGLTITLFPIAGVILLPTTGTTYILLLLLPVIRIKSLR